jgi:hypothetical protein
MNPSEVAQRIGRGNTHPSPQPMHPTFSSTRAYWNAPGELM